jgi:ubiquinone/menaquinone biosynthesis C-methylase UbiE
MSESIFFFTNRKVDPMLVGEFRRLAKKRKSAKILDIGCGDGVMIYDLQKRGLLKPGFSLRAIDIRADNVEFAKKRDLRARFEVADACALPFDDKSFDLVYSWMVIEHVDNPGKMASEISRVLKPGGRCYIATIMKRKWAVYFYRNKGKFVLDPTHVSEFGSEKEFRDLFEKNGLILNTLAKYVVDYPLIELVIKVMMRAGFLKQSWIDRNVFGGGRILRTLRKLKIKVYGFYRLRCVCERL